MIEVAFQPLISTSSIQKRAEKTNFAALLSAAGGRNLALILDIHPFLSQSVPVIPLTDYKARR